MKLKRFLAAAAAGTLAIAMVGTPASAAETGDPMTDDLLGFGDLVVDGNTGNLPLNSPIVGMAFDPDGTGYWEVGADGGVFAYDAPFLGSQGGKALNAPIVGMASVAPGQSEDGVNPGYYFVASDGGIFAYNAPFYGSMGGKALNAPIVGMATTNDGYYLVASDGGIFAYNVPFLGSQGGKPLNQPIVGMATTDTGGYYFVARDGGIFAYGDEDAPFLGSMGGQKLNRPIVGMAVEQNDMDGDGGYYLVAEDGGVFAFNATFYGSVGGVDLGEGKRVTGIYTDTTGGSNPGYFMTLGRSNDNYCTLVIQTVSLEEDLFGDDSDEVTAEDIQSYIELLTMVNKVSSDAAKPYWTAAISIWEDVAAGNEPTDADLQALADAVEAAHTTLVDRCDIEDADLGVEAASADVEAAASDAVTADS